MRMTKGQVVNAQCSHCPSDQNNTACTGCIFVVYNIQIYVSAIYGTPKNLGQTCIGICDLWELAVKDA